MEMAKDAEKNEGKKNEIYFVNIHIFHGVNAAKEGPIFRAGSFAIDFTQLGHLKCFWSQLQMIRPLMKNHICTKYLLQARIVVLALDL